jgi:hypothetical protein
MNSTIDIGNVPASSSKTRPSVWLLVGLLVAALVPVLVALALLGSALVHRPLLGRTRMTVVWGIGLLVIGGLQGAAELAGLSLTDPVGIAARTLGALALEAVLYVASNAYLRTR